MQKHKISMDGKGRKKILKIGHRGARAYEPENTMISFQKALALGADAVELDVHCCKSGELVVLHDFTLDRTTNASGEVKDFTLLELKMVRIEEKYSIPTLEEVIDFIDRRCSINIELKGNCTALGVSDLIEKYIDKKGWKYEDFIVSSFKKEELKEMWEINPKIIIGVLTETSITEALEWAAAFSAKAIHPDFMLLTVENVKAMQRLGYKVFPWTVNEREDIARIKIYGVEGIISDYPDRL